MPVTLKRRTFEDIEPQQIDPQQSLVIKRRTFPQENFDTWYAGVSKQYGLSADPYDKRHQYDYKAAYDAGIRKPDEAGHWPSKYKLPDHPNRFVDGIDTITGQPKLRSPITPQKPPHWIGEGIKETGRQLKRHPVITTLKGVQDVANVIRWPFRRFIEHPFSTIATAIQRPKGKTVGGTLKEAGKVFLPKRIPMQETTGYEKIWKNYWYSIMSDLKDEQGRVPPAPNWYLGLASFGTAMGIETPLMGVSRIVGKKGVEKTIMRKATPNEANVINQKLVNPIRQNLQKAGVDVASLPDEGSKITFTNGQEININKYATSALKGKDVMVPRGSKVKVPEVPASITAPKAAPQVTPKAPAIKAPAVTPTPKIVPPPKVKIPEKVPERPQEKAKFKIKIGEEWKHLTGPAYQKEIGKKVKFPSKKITDLKAAKEIKAGLTDIEETQEGDFLVIKGYPKKVKEPKFTGKPPVSARIQQYAIEKRAKEAKLKQPVKKSEKEIDLNILKQKKDIHEFKLARTALLDKVEKIADPQKQLDILDKVREIQNQKLRTNEGWILNERHIAEISIKAKEKLGKTKAGKVKLVTKETPEVKKVHQQAIETQPQLTKIAKDIADELKIDYIAKVKKIESLVLKVNRKSRPGYTASTPKDHTRATIYVKDFSQIPAVTKLLSTKGKWTGEATISNPLNQFGYRGIQATTKFANGINGEIQFHTKESWELKTWSDKIYKKWRPYENNGKLEVPADKVEQFKKDMDESHRRWEEFWNKIPQEVRESASSSVIGLESVIMPSVPSKASQPLPGLKTKAQSPLSIGRKSITRSVPSVKIPKSGISKPPVSVKSIPPKTVSVKQKLEKATGQTSIPVEPEKMRDPDITLSKLVKEKIASKKGEITIPGEPAKLVENTYDSVANLFTRYRNIDDMTREELVKWEEMIPKEIEDAANMAFNMVAKKFNKQQRDAIQLHMDDPSTYPMPDFEGAEKLVKQIDEIQELLHQTMIEAGYEVGKWPETKIDYLKDKIEDLRAKKIWYKSEKARKNAESKIQEMEKEIQQLKGVGYVHRVSRKTVKSKFRRAVVGKRISAKPVKFLGRSYNTIDDAKKAGIEVGDLTSSVAETIYEIVRITKTTALIDAINSNKSYALPAKKAPSDWETIDTRLFPSAQGKKYHPAMADAIEELTYSSYTRADKILKLYDKINVAGKFIGFYNPVFMTNYDVQQGWRAAGIDFFKNLPKAWKIWHEKGDEYYKMMEGGLFNKVIDYKPPIDVIVQQMVDQAEKSYGYRFAQKLADMLIHPIKAIQVFNNKTTWQIDELLRIAARKGIEGKSVSKGLNEFQVTDLANDFMAAYNKFPKSTKKTMNRIIFTPTYKVSMIRILGKMHKNPKQFKAQLARHHLYKLFLKFGLPAVVGSLLANEHKDEIVKVFSEKGYRLVIKIGDKVEKVYAISGPLLEETKIVHRKPEYSLYLNLSFGANLLNTIMNRNKWKYSEPDDLKRIGEFFKIGGPGIREYLNWSDKDKTKADKWLSQLGLAYVYTRLPAAKPKDERPAFIKALNAMDLWLEWRGTPQERKLKEVETKYRFYSDKIYRAIKRNDQKDIDYWQKEATKYFGKPFPVKNVESRIRREKRKLPTLTREEQRIRMKNKFLREVIGEPTTSKFTGSPKSGSKIRAKFRSKF